MSSSPLFLPDSRTREKRGGVRSAEHGTVLPIYCANCGKEWGLVPENHITFAFALCDPCAETHGDIAHTYKEPDEVFWERVNNAMQEEKIDTHEQLVVQLDDSSSTFAKLAEEWKRHFLSK